MKPLALLLVLALTGCAEMMNKGEQKAIASIQGQPADVAIQRFGIPTEEKTIAGRKVLAWKDVEARDLYCQMAVLYGEDGRAIKAELTGMNGPCVNWLKARGFW